MTHVEHISTGHTPAVAHRLDTATWGLFFVWVGVAFIAGFGWSLGLFGVGVITLGGQLGRKYFGLATERFWVAVGLLLALGAISEPLGFEFSPVPIVLIVAGLALLLSAMRRQSPEKEDRV